MIDISIIIVNWNVRELLRRCVESIPAAIGSLTAETIVIDNASSDRSETMLRGFPELTTILNKINVGFAKANNQGIARSRGEFILLLNPDTELSPLSLERMITFMRQRIDVDVSGCTLRNRDGTLQRSVRRFPSTLALALIILKLHNLWPNAPVLRKYFVSEFDYTHEQDVEQLMGAFLLIRRRTLDRVGWLDESFYLWFEEVDFCHRVIARGGRIVYTPVAHIIHAKGEGFSQLTPFARQRIFLRSVRRYARKHLSSLGFLLLAALTPLSLTLAAVVSTPLLRYITRALKKNDA